MCIRDSAVSAAFREWTNRIDDTHYCLGSVMGPHPFPTIVRDFQAVISEEIREQMLEKEGRLPDAVIALSLIHISSDAGAADFVSKYQAAYGETPNQFAADGYDCIYAIYAACQKAGITAEMGHEDVCEAMIEAFTASDFSVDGLTGAGMTWGTNGEVSKAPVVVKVENGAYATL